MLTHRASNLVPFPCQCLAILVPSHQDARLLQPFQLEQGSTLCLLPHFNPCPPPLGPRHPSLPFRSKTPIRSAFKSRPNPVLQFRAGPLGAGKPPLVPYA